MQETAQRANAIEDMFLAEENEEDTQADKYLIFRTGEEQFGIPIQHVTEIVELQKITRVPEMPDFIRGVMNLRGLVIPLIDVRLRFNIAEKEYDDRTCIVIIRVKEKHVGLIVDRVSEILEIHQDHVSAPPQFKRDGVRNRYIQGLGKVGDEVKILLNVEEILHEDELAVIGEMPVAAQ